MRSLKMMALGAVALCAVVGFGRPAFAGTDDSSSPAQSHSTRHGRWQKQFTRFSKALNLTEEQREQIRPFFEDQAEQVDAISHDRSVSKQDRQEKFHAIHSATEEKIEPLLTPEQMEQWGEWKQKNWDRAAERRAQSADSDSSQGNWRTHRRSGHEVAWQQRFEQFSKTLSLTEEQQEKIRPLFQDQAQQLLAVSNDTSLSQEDRQEKVKAIHSATEEKIEPFLSPDQMEKWGEWKQKGWDRAEERAEERSEQNQQSQQNQPNQPNQPNDGPSQDTDQKSDTDNK